MRRLAVLITVAMGLAVGAFVMGHHMATPAPTAITGTYDTPGGVLTVYGDHSARYESVLPEDLTPGACYVDTLNDTTGEQHPPYYACAPMYGPDKSLADGALIEDVWEDGSAAYTGTPWRFDWESGTFELRPSQVVRGTAPGAPTLTSPR